MQVVLFLLLVTVLQATSFDVKLDLLFSSTTGKTLSFPTTLMSSSVGPNSSSSSTLLAGASSSSSVAPGQNEVSRGPIGTPNKNSRVPYNKVCQIAGKKNATVEELRACIESGWSAHDIDDTVTNNWGGGKSALHYAAWKGSLENLKYLLEDVGCDINAYSKGQYSYGKTAIFFAATQSRVDVIEYLIENFPALKVNIINNKGQSPLSICSSHDMSGRVLQKIQQLSTNDEEEWWNFRLTHSDGLEYGDLDPRFLERPLRETDVVAPLAINPTTKKTRKGNFERNNKGHFHQMKLEKAGQVKPKKITKKKKAQRRSDLNEALQAIQEHEFWNHVSSLSFDDDDDDSKYQQQLATELWKFVQSADQYKCSWMPFVADQLVTKLSGNRQVAKTVIQQSLSQYIITSPDDVETGDSKDSKTDNVRYVKILERLSTLVDQDLLISSTKTGDVHQENNDIQHSKNNNGKPNHKYLPSLHRWTADIQKMTVSYRLNMSMFEPSTDQPNQLVLPEAPIFVNTHDEFLKMQATLKNCRILSIDTEWYDKDTIHTGSGRAEAAESVTAVDISTIQISSICYNQDEFRIATYVVDLLYCQEYYHDAQTFIRRILQNDEILILGFAIGNDMPHLERFCSRYIGNNEAKEEEGKTTSETEQERQQTLDCHSILDLQLFLCCVLKSGDDNGDDLQYCLSKSSFASLQGLKSCVSRFTDLPLSKAEQCSDWSQRPLTSSQLNYAGMDAAILFALLAEHIQKREINDKQPE